MLIVFVFDVLFAACLFGLLFDGLWLIVCLRFEFLFNSVACIVLLFVMSPFVFIYFGF